MAKTQKTAGQQQSGTKSQQPDDVQKQQTSTEEYDQLLEQTDQQRTRKPGSQSNS